MCLEVRILLFMYINMCSIIFFQFHYLTMNKILTKKLPVNIIKDSLYLVIKKQNIVQDVTKCNINCTHKYKYLFLLLTF